MNKVKYLLFTNRYSLIESFEKIKKKSFIVKKTLLEKNFAKLKKLNIKPTSQKEIF